MKLILSEKRREAGDATSFIFKTEAPLSWQAGQFLHYVLPHEHPDSRGMERWFTISAPPSAKNVMLTTRFAGERSSSFKKTLFALPIGSIVEADTPDGDFIIEDPSREFLFIAGGIGITPYHSILLDLDEKKAPIKGKLLYANRDNDFIFKDELEALAAKHKDFGVRYFVAPEQIDEAAIKKEAAAFMKPVFYVSGPEPMVESFEKRFGAMGVPEIDLKRDFFPGYAWPIV